MASEIETKQSTTSPAMTSAHATQNSWWEVEVHVPSALADDVGALILDGGADGVETILMPELRPQFDVDVEIAPDSTECVSASEDVALRVSFAEPFEPLAAEAVIVDAMSMLGCMKSAEAKPHLAWEKRQDEGWRERWKAYFKPLQVGQRLWVVPMWEQARFVAPRRDGIEPIVVAIEPGMAFGTGQHATTQLCLNVLETELDALCPQEREKIEILDVGCGSGVLSIAAQKLGVRRVLALDVDATAVAQTIENAEKNEVLWSDSKLRGIQTTERGLADVAQTYDWVVANILANILIDLAPELIAHTKPRGVLLLSGILKSQVDDVREVFLNAAARAGRSGWRMHQEDTLGDWCALRFSAGSSTAAG